MAYVKWLRCFNTFVKQPMHLRLWLLVICSLALTGCISDIWTGASLIYDRHHVYIKLNDFQLAAAANRALFRDQDFKCEGCAIEIAVLNRDVLMVGHVPTLTLRREATARISMIDGKRRFYDELTIYNGDSDPILDSWITTKIRSEILADSTIDPGQFKIVTADQVVYLMGDVIPSQAQKVIGFARECVGVKRVVKLLQYYHLSAKDSL